MKLGLTGWKKRAPAGGGDEGADATAGSPSSAEAAAQPPEAAGAASVELVPEPVPAWEKITNEPVHDHAPMRGDSVVIDEPNTEPGGLYIQESVLTSAITPVHIATQDRPADRRVESVERAAQAARLLVCDIQECSDHAEPMVAYALVAIARDASRVAVELQSVLAAMKKTP